ACEAATSNTVEQGNVGAGVGCRIGAMKGNEYATKGGIGSASIDLGDGLVVAALIAVNAGGDVMDEHGKILGGLRENPQSAEFAITLDVLLTIGKTTELPAVPPEENTVIGVVATNGQLSKEQVNKVAQMAHDGLARAVRPSHTMFDGDTIFSL